MLALLAATSLGISGQYLEVRTCALYAGPCHYSGEVMVDGRDAVVAWRFNSGVYNGVPLAGLAAAAHVSSRRNLNFGDARTSVLYLPDSASESQRKALINILSKDLPIDLGSTLIRDATISFDADAIRISGPAGIWYEAQTSMRECTVCTMPGVLWYEPLSGGVVAKVATVERQSLTDKTLGETWLRRDEPAAFVGTFSW
jgi:hypothetical protein